MCVLRVVMNVSHVQMSGHVRGNSTIWFPLQKILEEQRRLKREQEEADTASRRHTSVVPTHHQFITNERFGDLLNITDNTEKRKSGVEVRYGMVCPQNFCLSVVM